MIICRTLSVACGDSSPNRRAKQGFPLVFWLRQNTRRMRFPEGLSEKNAQSGTSGALRILFGARVVNRSIANRLISAKNKNQRRQHGSVLPPFSLPRLRGRAIQFYYLAFAMARYRKVTICARVQFSSGAKRWSPTPSVMPFSTAQATAFS